ncbi:MAG: DUF4177 domain-containing protein [Ruminococcus sp.]|nr:DUF4177 domain-containing protein [Ruminococcus sp.]
MKKYEYVRVSITGLSGRYGYSDGRGVMSPREVIDSYAAKGYSYKGMLPVGLRGSHGAVAEYDLVFETEV